MIKILFLTILLSGCGYFKGEKGDEGNQGELGYQGANGDQGETGDQGLDGSDGADGASGPRGPEGINGRHGENGEDGKHGKDGRDGLLEELLERLVRCRARFNYDKYNWYDLHFHFYFLTTGEFYTFGRSDLFSRDRGFRPDSASGFSDSLQTSTFDFGRDEGRFFFKHRHSGRRGFFDCSEEK